MSNDSKIQIIIRQISIEGKPVDIVQIVGEIEYDSTKEILLISDKTLRSISLKVGEKKLPEDEKKEEPVRGPAGVQGEKTEFDKMTKENPIFHQG